MAILAKLGKNNINAVIERENDFVLAKLIRTMPKDKNAKIKVVEITKDYSRAEEWLSAE